MSNQDIGRRIKNLREDNDWTQEDLAKRIHVTKSTISKIESGGQTLASDQLIAIAQALNARVEYLLCMDDDPDDVVHFLRSHTQVTSTAKYKTSFDGIISPESLSFHVADNLLMLVGKESLFAFLKEIAAFEEPKSSADTEYRYKVETAVSKYRKEGKQAKDIGCFLVSGKQLEKLVEEQKNVQQKVEKVLRDVAESPDEG